ncbi:MAG: alcohol dehydrogenase catalytic domain-containing protein [Lentisphaeria bacterium]|nr:alcohol dehydrogenase catalytic domain-containing protein [Lentisphaeria bacterium]NQZ69021.1 alcohol dehydrogenase catalytic domain-containing protein [Lentisphaeria bacterium]
MKQEAGPGHLELVDTASPEPGPNDVKIAIRAAGICGTDIHIVHDTFPYNPPVILGHEFCGEITELGSTITGLEVGDRVMAETTAVLCGVCASCRNGDTNHCLQRRAYGVHVNGGFAESVVVRQEAIHRLPENVDYLEGAMTEPLAVCVHALMERIQVTAGQLLLVLGPGPIGLFAAMLAKTQGAIVIVAGTSRDKQRLQLAETIGVDLTVNVESDDLPAIIDELSLGAGGVDITVEAAGAAASVKAAYQCTRKGGTIVQLGLFEEPITIDYSQIAVREFNVIGSFAHRWSSFNTALQLMDKKIVDVKPLVSAVINLDDGLEAFQRAEAGADAKILLTPGGLPDSVLEKGG